MLALEQELREACVVAGLREILVATVIVFYGVWASKNPEKISGF